MPRRVSDHHYFVYITASWRQVLYTGVTSGLEGRVWKHKAKAAPGFTANYNAVRLVWYEMTTDVHAALAREKQIKGWLRAKKVALITAMNPDWRDLAEYLDTKRDSSPLRPRQAGADSGVQNDIIERRS